MKKPLSILYQWLKHVNANDAKKLLSLYDKNAVLIPTFSKKILNTPEKIRNYFKNLTSQPYLAITLQKKSLTIRPFQKKLFILSGIYTWHFKKYNKQSNCKARFTFVINLSKKAPVIHHHSSTIPHSS